MKEKLKTYALSPDVLFWLYLIVAVVASVHLIALGNKAFNGLNIYTHYNNFVIFRQSFFHLIHNQDLYILHPAEQYDLFKYSPTFALAMFPFALLPQWFSLILWNVFSSALLFSAVKKFPFASQKTVVFALWFLLQENLTAIQSAQTNSMIAALLLFAFIAFEKQKTHWAALFIVLTVFIKIFGAVAFLLFLLYPNKGKFILWSAVWSLILLLLPLVVISPEQLIFLYKSWWNMLQNDHSASVGFSVIGWLKTWFNLEPNKLLVVLIGAFLLMLPLIRTKLYDNILFRKLMLASALIWVIIFNHKAESSTFIIAVTGIAVWWFSIERNKFLLALVMLAFIFTCLSPTDLFPRSLRNDFVTPYVLKAIPCILIWCVIQYQLLTSKNN